MWNTDKDRVTTLLFGREVSQPHILTPVNFILHVLYSGMLGKQEEDTNTLLGTHVATRFLLSVIFPVFGGFPSKEVANTL